MLHLQRAISRCNVKGDGKLKVCWIWAAHILHGAAGSERLNFPNTSAPKTCLVLVFSAPLWPDLTSLKQQTAEPSAGETYGVSELNWLSAALEYCNWRREASHLLVLRARCEHRNIMLVATPSVWPFIYQFVCMYKKHVLGWLMMCESWTSQKEALAATNGRYRQQLPTVL